MNQAFVIKREELAPELDVVGTRVSTLAFDGQGDVTLQHGAEGTGPPPPLHAWDEPFNVLEGHIGFTCDGNATMGTAGTLDRVPAGSVHTFRCGPGGGKMLEFTGSGSRTARMFSAVDREIPADSTDILKAVSVLARHGVEVKA